MNEFLVQHLFEPQTSILTCCCNKNVHDGQSYAVNLIQISKVAFGPQKMHAGGE